MGGWSGVVAAVVFLVGLAVALAWRPLRSLLAQAEFDRARTEFHRQRERLEARFFELAAASGKPRGLRWTDVDFENDVAYARDRKSGELCALVGVTISFEAVEGGGMEEVEAVSNLRAATAVFRRESHAWRTDGRAIFNLSPVETIAHYEANLELVGREVAQRV